MQLASMCKLSDTLPTRPRNRLSLPAAAIAAEESDPAGTLSPSARATYAMIALAAEAGEPCPSNRIVAAALGFGSVGHVPAVLNRIQAAGLIRIERGSTSRIVTILANGKRTAGEPGAIHWRYRPENRDRRHAKYGDGRPRKRAERAAASGMRPPRVDREPCFYCGVRGDVGCAHRRRGA